MKTLFDKPLYEVVIEMLETNKYNRDDDALLYNNLCYRKGLSLDGLSVVEFLKQMSDKALPNFQSVSRLRRLAQMKHKHLRGATWAKRRKVGEQLHAEMAIERSTPV